MPQQQQPSGSASMVTESESSVSFPLHQQPQTAISTTERQSKRCGAVLEAKPHPNSSYASEESCGDGHSLSAASVTSYTSQSEVENIMPDKSGSVPSKQKHPPPSDQLAKTLLESSVAGHDKDMTAVPLDIGENFKDRPDKSGDKNISSGSPPSLIDARESTPDSNVPNTTSIPATESVPPGTGQWRPDSMKGSRTVAAQVIPHPPAPPPPRYIPFAPPGTGGRLLHHRHPPDVAKDGSLPAEAVLGYLMSPTRRTGVERKSGGVTLQSLNHKEVRAVSGMLRSIVRSANRSQAGYLMPNRKQIGRAHV